MIHTLHAYLSLPLFLESDSSLWSLAASIALTLYRAALNCVSLALIAKAQPTIKCV